MTDGKMRHIALQTVASLVGLLGLASCAKTAIPAPEPDGEWVPLEDFTLTYRTTTPVVITKAAQSTAIENTVNNLYVFLVDETDGSIVHRRSYLVSASTAHAGYDDVINAFTVKQEETDASSQGMIPGFFTGFSGTLSSGNSYKFYAIANYPTSLAETLNEIESGSTEYVVNTLSELTSQTVVNSDGVVERNFFLMTAEQGVSVISGTGTGIDGTGIQNVVLNLQRADAKITFEVSVNISGAKDGDFTFTDMKYKVHNVPDASYVFGKAKVDGAADNTWDAAAQLADFSCMLDDNYQTFDRTDASYHGGTFTFYMRENRPVVETSISSAANTSYASLYAMREAWDYDDTGNPNLAGAAVHGRSFKYAPAKATFVEINGILSYTRTAANGEEEQVYADVTYLVHLGETGSDPDDVDLVNNYDVKRNVHYTYRMSITGINSFEIEVDADAPKETRPGAEGSVVLSNNTMISLDSHYGRFLLTLNRNDLMNIGSWSVTSPMNVGTTSYHPNENGGLITSPYDYKWALFAVNSHFGVANDKMAKFPGVQAYDGGLKFFDGTAPDATETLDDQGNSFVDNVGSPATFRKLITQDNYYYDKNIDDDACLRDVHQLVRYLVNEANDQGSTVFDANGDVAITVFVDEYTYIYDPATQDYVHPGQSVSNLSDPFDRLLLWRRYADAEDRVMNINPMATTEYSPDKNTSVTKSFVSIAQKSIKTVYNPGNVTTAWGLEVDNETGELDYQVKDINALQTGSRANTLYDGRTNFLNFLVDGSDNTGSGVFHWTDIMNVEANVTRDNIDAVHTDYQDPFYACVTRNRDLNGNNLIDADEVFWYLAAREQVTGIWLGQDSLQEDAWLTGKTESAARHYITSSRHSETGLYTDFYIVWAEEGCSLGSLRHAADVVAMGQSTRYDYRCVRNLGIDIKEAAAPTNYATINTAAQTDGGVEYLVIDANNLNSRALRSDNDRAGLPVDTERSLSNRPYSSIDVKTANDTYGQDCESVLLPALLGNNNPCPTGWRVPNQREMLLMIEFFDELNLNQSGNLGVATTYSFTLDTRPYRTFYCNISERQLQLKANSARPVNIRCVRDHTN